MTQALVIVDRNSGVTAAENNDSNGTVICRECRREVSPSYVRSRNVRGATVPGAWCVYCEGDHNAAIAARTRDRVLELTTGNPTPERERQLAKELRDYGHPDVDGLMRAVGERRAKETKPDRSRRM